MRVYAYAAAAVLAVTAISAIALIRPGDAPGAGETTLSASARGIVPATFEADRRLAEAVLDAINEERRYAGLAPVAWDLDLAAAAADQATEMAAQSDLDNAARGVAAADRLDQAALESFPLTREIRWRARNQATWRPEALADAMVRDWMGRPGSIAALVDPDITHAGGAILRRGYDGRAVMVFGGRAERVW